MFQFISGLLCGFLGGFTTGYLFNFLWNIYNRYKINGKNTQKALAQEIFTLYSSRIFDVVYTGMENNTFKIPDLNELLVVSNDIIDISKDYNNKFKVIMKKGSPVIKINDDSYLQDKKFVKVLKFLNKNDIEITLLKSDKETMVNELE